MHNVQMKKKDEYHCGTIKTPINRNIIPIQYQIMAVAVCKRHDKSKSRAKQKRAWQKGD